MPTVRKKHTPMRRDMRRSQNWKLEIGSLSKCSQCGAAHLPHRVCSSCGYYGNELVLPPKVKDKKKDKGQ